MKKALQPDEFDPASDEATDAAIDKMLLIARQRLARAIAPIRRSIARVGIIESPLGRLLAAESPRGLVALTYLDTRDGATVLAALRQKFDLVEDAETAARIGGEIERQTGGQGERQTGREVQRQTGGEIQRQSGGQVQRQTRREIEGQAGAQACRQGEARCRKEACPQGCAAQNRSAGSRQTPHRRAGEVNSPG